MFDLNNIFLNTNTKTREVIADMRALKAYQNELTASDYKIIKCYEYSLAGLELPYDVNALHSEREAIREKIRFLEEKL